MVNNMPGNRTCDPALCHLQIVLVPLNGHITSYGFLQAFLTSVYYLSGDYIGTPLVSRSMRECTESISI